jgi:hypothetical protein
MRAGTRFFAILAATTALILGGSTVAFALWSANGSVSSTATAATVSVSHALTGSTLTQTYSASNLVAVGVVTVTNSSSRAGTYSVALSSTSSSSTLRAAVAVEIGTAASCTTSATLSSATTGTMAATVTATGSIAAGASVPLCVRTTMTSGGVSANASATLSATIASSVTVGTWSATASPAITFTQTVAAPTQTVDTGAWYWFISTINTSLCAEGLNYGSGDGTALVQGNCSAPNGSDANELFRFVPTTGGYYRIIVKNAQSLGIGTTAGNNKDAFLASGTGSLIEWGVVFNSDSTITLQSRNNTGRCLTIPGSSSAAGVQLQVSNCSTGSASQKFTLTTFNTATPPPAALTCSADGYNAYYSWPQLTGYQNEVVYRVYIGGILDTTHSRGTGWDTTIQFGNGGVTTAAYGSGSKTVLVQQSVAGGAWSNVGTGTIVIAASAPYLQCG